ncbi:MAG: hypothetical protein OXC66_13495 [Roseovarius sp.]|nr:hypothetical protein [Roseovarius sp.]
MRKSDWHIGFAALKCASQIPFSKRDCEVIDINIASDWIALGDHNNLACLWNLQEDMAGIG